MSARDRTPPCITPVFTFLLLDSCWLVCLHIVVASAMDCSRYVGVGDTIEQLLMVLIVECSCHIERDVYFSGSWRFY